MANSKPAPILHFVTGKGGVGKSTFAITLAEKLASEGRKTLLVDLSNSEIFKAAFDLKRLEYQPQKVKSNLFVANWDGPDCLREYIKYFIKIEALTALFFENPVTRALVNIAPGLKELAILGKATSAQRNHGPRFEYEEVVIDAYATGHFLALLRAPRGMAKAISKGPMGEQSRNIDAVLGNPNLSKFYIVTLAEELPVEESIELYEVLKSEFNIEGKFVLNRFIPTEYSSKDFEKFDQAGNKQSFPHIFLEKLRQQEQALKELSKFSKSIYKVFFRANPVSNDWLQDLEASSDI